MEYDLTRLGPEHFGYLVRDLVRSLLGIDIPLGDVSSSGMESVVTGRIAWPAGPNQQIWGDATFVKTLFVGAEHYHDIRKPTALAMIQDDLANWGSGPIEKLTRRGERIRNLFYICNAPLAFDFQSDLQQLVERYKYLKFENCEVWGYPQLCLELDSRTDVRTKFAGLIATSAALTNLGNFLKLQTLEIGDTIIRQLAMDLIADQWIRIGNVGPPGRQRIPLSSVAIDLPIHRNENASSAAKHILSTGDLILRPSYRATARQPHIVLVGGPGQGKTTIGQLVSQVYRSSLLTNGPHLGEEVSELLTSTQRSSARIGLARPRNLRWPIRIELAAYADADTKENLPLLRYIVDRVNARSSDHIDVNTMRAWLRSWPWLLVLDGLDEVTSQRARDALVRRTSEFFVEAAKVDCDLLVVATTRPQGYTGELSSDRYEHVYLSPLKPGTAASYAKLLAQVQHASDPDLQKNVIERTRVASEEESTARLMSTPLQVTIMSLLLENRERAPQARYALFQAYYQAIYSREATKPGALGALLENLRPHIDALHDRVGLLLHVQAEEAGESDAALPQTELHKLAALRLTAEGYDAEQADRMADQVLRAVTQRLVLIVPKGLDEVGFEVRSIQEFMAARALVTGRDTAILSRLSLLVPAVHWRNTWLFAAGRVFAQYEHLRRDLIAVAEDADSQDVVNIVVAPGADLALDMLEDDLTTGTPVMQRSLVRHALTLLRCAPDEDLRRRAGVLYRCSTDQVIRVAIDQAIADALEGQPCHQAAAYELLEAWQAETGGLALRARQIMARRAIAEKRGLSSKSWESREQNRVPSILQAIGDVLREEALEPANQESLEALLVKLVKTRNVILTDMALEETLSVEERATVFAKIVLALADQPATAAKLRSALRMWSSRRPKGADLLRVTPYP
jgi:hypothetical protein